MTTWGIKDSNGRVLRDFHGSSRIAVGCKVVPACYDAFRLHVSASYRELFDRALQHVLDRNGWQIVEIKRRKAAKRAPHAAVVRGKEAACAPYPGITDSARACESMRCY